MNFTQREIDILKLILINNNIKGFEIEEKLNISRNQLNYSLSRINDFLHTNNINQISRTRQGFFLVNQQTAQYLSNCLHISSDINKNIILENKDRQNLLLLYICLFNGYLKLAHFTCLLNVSKNTILKDINSINDRLESFSPQLSIKYNRSDGYFLGGNEENIRAFFYYFTSKLSNDHFQFDTYLSLMNIDKELIEEITYRISLAEKNLYLKITEAKHFTLVLNILFQIIRIKSGNYITLTTEQFGVVGTKEFEIVVSSFKKDNYPTLDEITYLVLLILSSDLYSSDERRYEKYMPIVLDIISKLELYLSFTFNDKDSLAFSICQHWIPAEYRINNHFHISNPLHENIKEEYRYLYSIVKKLFKPLFINLNQKIPDEEVSLLTILIGGYLRRENYHLKVIKPRAIVVCPSGVSISRFILNNLIHSLPEINFIGYMSISDFNNLDDSEFDIVFSAVELESSKNVYIINESLSNSFLTRLRNTVLMNEFGVSSSMINIGSLMEIIKKNTIIKEEELLLKEINSLLNASIINPSHNQDSPTLLDLLKINHIIISSDLSWKSAIIELGNILLGGNYIEKRYIDKTLDIIENDKPFITIAPNTIVAHAPIDYGVKNLGMSLLISKHRININNYLSANFILFLATPEFSIHLKALDQFAELISSPENQALLLTCNDSDSVLKFIDDFIQHRNNSKSSEAIFEIN